MKIFIAVDLGGTLLRASAYPEGSREALRDKRISTLGDGSIFDRLVELICDVKADDEVLSLAVVVPGPMNPRTGELFSPPNLPEWRGCIPLQQMLMDQFDFPVTLGNDANAAALGEWKFGAGVGHSDVLYLTISTGIGGGVILDNQLLLGRDGLGAELGHIAINFDGPLCSCGKRGHVEAYASGKSIARYFMEQLTAGRKASLTAESSPTARSIAEAASAGDSLALETFKYAGTYLGRAIAGFLHAFNPSIVILGGGVSRSGSLLLDPVKKTLPEHVISTKYIENLVVTTALLGDDAGLLGALVLAQDLINPDLIKDLKKG